MCFLFFVLTESVSSRILGHGEGAVGRGLPDVLVVLIVLGDDLLLHSLTAGSRKTTGASVHRLLLLLVEISLDVTIRRYSY